MSTMDWETLKRLVSASERLSIGSYFLDVSGDCLDPGRRTLSGLPPRGFGAWMSNSGTTVSLLRGFGTWAEPMFDRPLPVTLSISARCRKCAACLASRRRLWQARVAAEVRYSERSWFGTLTFRPEEHYLAELRARAECARKSVAFDTLPPWEKFAHLHRANGPDLTKWLKRIRKESGATLRYILVAEAHKTGLPHYHVLVHERGHVPVRERTLRLQWTLGHSKFNLVDGDPRSARYVCKYLAKAAEARVRASKHYGLLRS